MTLKRNFKKHIGNSGTSTNFSSITLIPLMHSLKNLFFAFFITCSLMTPIFSLAAPTEQEVSIVQQLIQMVKSADKIQASKAALALGAYSYHEVNQALLLGVKQELSRENPSLLLIENMIKSISLLATVEDFSILNQLKARIDKLAQIWLTNRTKDQMRFSQISEQLEQIIKESAFRNSEDLQNLVLLLTDQSSKGELLLPSKQLFEAMIRKTMNNIQYPDAVNSASILLAATSSFLSDEILERIRKNEQPEILGLDKEAEQAIDTLTREKGKNPILVGPRGAGKTTIVQKIARILLEDQLPPHMVFQKELAGAFVIETTPARIARLAKGYDDNAHATALETYFNAILNLEMRLGIKIVLFLDEIHTLNNGQIEAMKPYLDSKQKAIKLIGATTSVEYQNAFKQNPALQRRFDPIGVAEQAPSEVKKIILISEKPKVEKRYGFNIEDAAVEVIVRNANRVYPDTSLVDAAAKMLTTICSAQARKIKINDVTQSLVINEAMVYEFIQVKLGYPVNPLDVNALKKYKDDLVNTLNTQVIGQERMVEDVTDEWIRVLKSNQSGVRSIMMMGPTGVGKSHLARELAKKLFGTEGAFLEVDANQFKEGKYSNYTFFGAPNGVMSSDKTSGVLFDYLDDPGKGKFGGVIVINEAERAHTDFWEKMMEILDTGKARGGDGKERILGRHLIILTSNRGDTALYPKTLEDWTDSEYQAHKQTLTEERLKTVFKEATTGQDQFRLPDAILGRINKFTAAEPMVPAKIRLVAIQKAQKILRQIEINFKIKIELDEQVAAEIAKAFYQKGLGARPVEKKVTDLIESAVDNYLVQTKTQSGDLIKIGLKQVNKVLSIEVQGPGGTTEMPLPISVKQDFLSDQELLARLGALEPELKTRILGQDEMIGRITEAVIAHQSTQGKRPLSIFAVGTTGTGKTETAKALARTLYQSENRVLVLDMGKVIYEGEFNNIFGSPAGHVGSLDERIFEQFLRENPQGGVIVFDEISNMGGKDPAQKQALFKKLYSIFEEGVWTSPATSKSYSLSKYTILNTGNDLETLLQGISADDMRLAIWSKNKSPSNVRALLLKSGVPEAFLGRMADIILMKPLLKSEVNKITAKILKEQVKEFEEKGLEIHFSESFIKDVSNIFFTQSQGARSIRNLVEFRVKSALTQLIIRARGIQNLQGKKIFLSVQDNQIARTYIKASDPERKVVLKASLSEDNLDAVTVTVDATEFASKINLQTKKEILRTSYHEAGHAVVNDPTLTGERIALITVVGQDNYYGYARYEEMTGKSQSPSEKTVIVQIARLLAGQTAERLAGYEASAGWANDLEKARGLASRYLLEWGFGKNMVAVPIDDKGMPKLSEAKAQEFETEMNRLFAQAQTLAENSLRERWQLVRAIVSELYKNSQITGARFTEIETQMRLTSGLSKWLKESKSDKLIRDRQIQSQRQNVTSASPTVILSPKKEGAILAVRCENLF